MTAPSANLQFLFLFLAGAAVTGLTELVKKIAETTTVQATVGRFINVDSTWQKRTAAAIVTLVVFGVTKIFDLAPDLQKNLGEIVIWLGTTYGLAAGIYEHAPEKVDPAQLSGPPKVTR